MFTIDENFWDDDEYAMLSACGFDLNDSVNQTETLSRNLSTVESLEELVANKTAADVICSSKAELPRNINLRKNYHKRRAAVHNSLESTDLKPKKPRRLAAAVLYAFPSFDRCDSLLYMPNTMTRLLNSSDIDGIRSLFGTHLDKNCLFGMHFGHGGKFTADELMDIWHKTNDLEPDRMMCVHTTKVVENQIKATLYSKVTDSQPLCNYMARYFEGTVRPSMYSPNRAERLLLYTQDGTTRWSDALKAELMKLATTNDDILVYMQWEMIITIGQNNKVSSIDFHGGLTSAHGLPGSVVSSLS